MEKDRRTQNPINRSEDPVRKPDAAKRAMKRSVFALILSCLMLACSQSVEEKRENKYQSQLEKIELNCPEEAKRVYMCLKGLKEISEAPYGFALETCINGDFYSPVPPSCWQSESEREEVAAREAEKIGCEGEERTNRANRISRAIQIFTGGGRKAAKKEIEYQENQCEESRKRKAREAEARREVEKIRIDVREEMKRKTKTQ